MSLIFFKMLLSHTCQVALKSVAYIAGSKDRCVNVRELAEKIDESPHTIAKVLQTLVKSGFLSSVTGPLGGFFLTEQQMLRPLIEIVNVVDGEGSLKSCVLGLKDCSSAHPCPVHDKFLKIRKDITKVFEVTSFSNITPAFQKGSVFLS